MRISVNNQPLEVSGQRLLIEELRQAGFDVPSMCYAEGSKHQPSCMVCMVKDCKTGQMLPSCATRPYEGMEIETDSDEVLQMRRLSLELLLSDHRADCEAPCTMVCQRGIDVAGVLRLHDLGRDDQARQLLRGVSCDGCPAPCEKACRRLTIDQAVDIRALLNGLRQPTASVPGGSAVAPAVAASVPGGFAAGSSVPAPAPELWKGPGGLVPFNSRLGRFTEQEKQRMKATYTQPSRCLHCACDGRSDCKLRRLATKAGIKVSRYGVSSTLPVKEQISVGSHLVFEPAKCIRCGLCVYNTDDGFTFERRGFSMSVVPPVSGGTSAAIATRRESEKLARLCPTGALVLRLLLPLLMLLASCRSLTEGAATDNSLPDQPQLLWEHRHGVRTVAAPRAYNGMVLSCDKHGLMTGFDQLTGEELLTLRLGDDMEASFTIEDSTLYVGMIDGRIRSISLADGSDNWSFPTEGQIAAAPLLATVNGRKRLFVGSYDNYMYTLKPGDGSLVSRVPTGYYVNGAAALCQHTMLFGGCDAWLRLVDGDSGQATDSLKLDAYIPASPVVSGSQAYVADYQGNVYELTLSDGRIATHRKLRVAAADDGGMLSMPVVTDDALVLLTTDRRLLCLDRSSGSQRWQAPLGGDAGECTPLLVGNRLLVCTKSGIVTIHDVLTGEQRWQYETGEQIIAQPVVVGDRFFVQTARGTLLCFGEANSPTRAAWSDK